MTQESYKKQVALVLEVLPFLNEYQDFAVKGGTALNLFYYPMPRLSVDIDLVYLPIENRKTTYKNIHEMLASLKESLELNLGAKVFSNHLLGSGKEAKLIVEKGGVTIKIEPNYIIRGSVFAPQTLLLSKNVTELFQVEVDSQCLSKEDLVGGKICAALDRQHPRDLFDIKLILADKDWHSGYTRAFIFYLLSSPRPIHELLMPNLKNLEKIFDSDFKGMTDSSVTLSELEEARRDLVNEISKIFTKNDKDFLLSFVIGNPFWKFLDFPEFRNWPSVLWKLHNIEKMKMEKREEHWGILRDFFEEKS